MTKAVKYPKEIGACIDRLYKMREERKLVERKAKELGEAEDDMEKHILNTFEKSKLEGSRGRLAQATRSPWERPIIADFDKLIAYVAKNKAWDLLQRRLATTAVEERWRDGKAIPGLDKMGGVKLSLTKVKTKSKE